MLKRLTLLAGSIAFAMLIVEIAARVRADDVLFSLKLRSRPTAAVPPGPHPPAEEVTPALLAHVRDIPLRPGIDQNWFQIDPADLPRSQVDPALQARYEEFDRRGLYPPQSFYVWNAELLKEACGRKADVFGKFPRDVKAFEPADPLPHPAYRFPASQTLPSGLVTNAYGFRGPAIAPTKSRDVIRIAFVGASTTQSVHSFRWSYPEIAGNWLNVWLQHQGRPERVEIINAGREGLNAPDILQIVEQEVLPLQPDYVVYLEGADLMQVPAVKWPGGQPPPAAGSAPDRRGLLRRLSDYSAAAKALVPVVARMAPPLDEPSKPQYEIQLPSPDRATLPELSSVFGPFLHTITENLDADLRSIKAAGAQLVLSSVIRLVHQGLRLDPVTQSVTYTQLNTLFQPLTYGDIRRLVDLQNTAYRLYAADRGIDLMDVAGGFPRDPDLFIDTFHLSVRGVRLHAWLVFLRLSAILERDRDRLDARVAPPASAPTYPRVSDVTLPTCTP